MVKTICYGREQIWNKRSDAIEYFWCGMISCLGSSEGERYGRIYTRLMCGDDVATDEDSFKGVRAWTESRSR